MKKIILILSTIALFGKINDLRGQCYGVVHLDATANASGSSSFTISTSNPNELILIAYDGWPSPGLGPVRVDGNNATHIVTGFDNNNSGIAEVYAYSAPSAGTHSIVCTEPSYSSPYYLNLAASFYASGTCTPISINSITYSYATITCTTGGSITTSTTTSIPGSMIYCDFENNNGQSGPFTDSWTGATFINQLHEGDGIDASQAYKAAATPGTYTITAGNNAILNNGCGGLVLDLIDIIPPLCSGGSMLVSDNIMNPTCNLCNGAISFSASGGSSPYTYSWAPNANTSSRITGLCAGTYTCSVQDASCHDTSIVVTLTSSALLVNANITASPLCNGQCVGSAYALVSGGTSPYTYSWVPVRVGNTLDSVSGLCAGTYTLTVSDINGCNDTDLVVITQPAVLVAIMGGTPTNVSCFGGNNGRATVTAAGGTSPYTYSWTPAGGTGAAGTNLTAGSYTVTVTDVNGCSATASIAIVQPPQLTAVISAQTNISCNGASNGSATVSVSGGTTAYRYSWFPLASSNATVTGLAARSYTVTVTDAHSCAVTASVTITQPPLLTTTIGAMTGPSCHGGNNGTATATPSGGTPVYTYSWSPVGGTNAMGTGLSIGTYTVRVTDSRGCNVTASITVTQPAILTASIGAPTEPTCNGGNNGSATATPSGGTPGYAYVWTPVGGTGTTGTGLSAGIYSVTVTDANGCTATASVSVGQPSAVTATTSSTPASCNLSNGSVTAQGSGGTSPYVYSWSPIATTGATVSNLSAGNYTVTITDNNGCSATASAVINHPPSVNITATVLTNILCNGGNGGSASVSASGGSSPFTYSWTPAGGTNTLASSLTAGIYTITVTDINGCDVTASVAITQPPLLTATMGLPVNILCNGGNNGSVTVTAGGGTSPYTYSWSPVAGTNASINSLTAGVYSVTITDAQLCTASASVTITQPPVLSATMGTPVNASCNGGGNGSDRVTASGGTPNYVYLWTPTGQTTANATGLTAGTYTVKVTDANGCTVTASIAIVQPIILTAAMGAPTNVLCNGGSNGSATVTAAGGTPAYTYAWTSGGTNPTAIGLTAGNYTVIITDANSCTASASVTITQPTALAAFAVALSNIPCNGGNGGSAMVSASGGTIPYAYSWTSNGGTNATANSLTAGIYTVTVTDANGCIISASATITQPLPLSTIIVAPTNILCNGGNNGSATVTTAGGTLPYTYSWTPVAGTDATLSGLTVGTFTITVNDANACQSSSSVIITQPEPLAVGLVGPKSICVGQTGTLTASVAGGTSPYAYSWSNGATTSSLTILAAPNQSFKCIVTDANGCTDSSSIVIQLGPELIITISGPTSVCSGNEITLCANATGGVGNKTYSWEPGGFITNCINVSPITSTIYTLTVSDGCGGAVNVSAPVNVIPLPKVNFAINFQEGCAPLCIQFRDLSSLSEGKASRWLWNFGNRDSANSQNPLYCYPNAGNFSVGLTVTSDSGCSASLNVNNDITVYSHPQASFSESPQPTTILAPTIQFTDKSTDQYGIVYWFWNFGDTQNPSGGSDSSIANLQNPSYTYSDTGTYCPSLVAMNIHGCTDTTTDCLIISPVFNLYIPSAFTPNGDGVNDVFQPKGSYIKSFEMYIFDRWGMELFHTTDINKGWNGTVSTDKACLVCTTISQEDTYIYKIYATDAQDNAHTYIGQVNLLK